MGRVQKYVRDHFPDMKGVKPSVSSRKSADQIRYRFTFRKTLQASDGQKLRQILHLTADEEGNVVKASVSR
jgi:hypothetical protein